MLSDLTPLPFAGSFLSSTTKTAPPVVNCQYDKATQSHFMSNHLPDAALHPAAQGTTYISAAFAWAGLSSQDLIMLAAAVSILLGTVQLFLVIERRFRGGGKRRKEDKQEHESE
jgi:hypothetical protein